MATTDNEIALHRPLAEFAWRKKVEYDCTLGLTREQFMQLYEQGELALSTVYENLFVSARTRLGKPTHKVSEAGRDFSNNGDMKIGTIKKIGKYRKYGITRCRKAGTIYFVGYNRISDKMEFFAIPFRDHRAERGTISIGLDPVTGAVKEDRTWSHCQKQNFEELCLYG